MSGRPSTYSPEDDALIQRMRDEGASWEAIGAVLEVSGQAAMQRARLKMLPCWIYRSAHKPEPPAPLVGRARFGPEPLPPMHPWALAVLQDMHA